MNKKLILIISVFMTIFLISCTVVSFYIWDKNLPKVRTYYYHSAVLADIQSVAYFLREDAVVLNGRNENVVYRLRKRMGWFNKEYYVDEIPLDIHYENDQKVYRENGDIRVIALGLEEGDQIIYQYDGYLKNDATVKWIEGEKGKYNVELFD